MSRVSVYCRDCVFFSRYPKPYEKNGKCSVALPAWAEFRGDNNEVDETMYDECNTFKKKARKVKK